MAKFCDNCGTELNENADVCLGCGKRVSKAESKASNGGASKSKVTAALLAFFLGSFGIHNFYLGHTGKGIAQLLLTIFGFILSFIGIGLIMVSAVSIWVLVEFILILCGKIQDSNGNDLA